MRCLALSGPAFFVRTRCSHRHTPPVNVSPSRGCSCRRRSSERLVRNEARRLLCFFAPRSARVKTLLKLRTPLCGCRRTAASRWRIARDGTSPLECGSVVRCPLLSSLSALRVHTHTHTHAHIKHAAHLSATFCAFCLRPLRLFPSLLFRLPFSVALSLSPLKVANGSFFSLFSSPLLSSPLFSLQTHVHTHAHIPTHTHTHTCDLLFLFL